MKIVIPLLVAGLPGVATAGQAAEDRARCGALIDSTAALVRTVQATKANHSMTIFHLQQSADITKKLTKNSEIISGVSDAATTAERTFNEDYKDIAAALKRLLTSIDAVCH